MFEYPNSIPELQACLNRIKTRWQEVRSTTRRFYQFTDDALTFVQKEIDKANSNNEYPTVLHNSQFLHRIEEDHIVRQLTFNDLLCEDHAHQIKFVTLFAPQLTHEQYWEYLRAVYDSGYFIEGSCFKELNDLFFVDRPNRELLMDEKEQSIYHSLPDEFSVYSAEITAHNDETAQGTHRFFRRWVIHRKDAITHAKAMMYQLYGTECKIIKKSILKSQVVACFDSYYGTEVLHKDEKGQLELYVNRVNLLYTKRERLNYLKVDGTISKDPCE